MKTRTILNRNQMLLLSRFGVIGSISIGFFVSKIRYFLLCKKN